jgi:hypothetical protein
MLRHVRTWLPRFGIPLLIAVGVTWGLAWGCALWSPIGPEHEVQDYGGHEATERADALGLNASAYPRGVYLDITTWTGFGLHYSTANMMAKGTSQIRHGVWPPKTCWQTETQAGWPWPAFKAVEVDDGTYTIEGGFKPPRFLRSREGPIASFRLIPTRIEPTGFVLDMLVAAPVMLLLVEGMSFVRRVRRKRRGECPSCGYVRNAIDPHARCPECGHTRS